MAYLAKLHNFHCMTSHLSILLCVLGLSVLGWFMTGSPVLDEEWLAQWDDDRGVRVPMFVCPLVEAGTALPLENGNVDSLTRIPSKLY